ncbi:CsxC family protein [Tissierella praeacuta]|uniref:CsxC family protein n=1 Tax=Tissierella praeacuta TaxID=43131 RepID=UPI003342C5D9
MYNSIDGTTISNLQVFSNNNCQCGGQSRVNTKPSSPVCNAGNKALCVDVKSDVLDSCTNTPVTPSGLATGAVAKIPVVLAELTVRFHVRALIDLPERALEIKNIKKKIKITQCLLLQPTNILFIKGFVRKNIDYATGNCGNIRGVCGELHHCVVDVPFECSTPVSFYMEPEDLAVNSSAEFEYFRVSDLPNKHFAEKDKLLSSDLSEFNQIVVENFNELPFCELISARIYEFDEFINRHRPCDGDFPFEEKFFNKIEEKMVVELTVKVLQNRQVQIPTSGGGIGGGCSPSFCSTDKDK